MTDALLYPAWDRHGRLAPLEFAVPADGDLAVPLHDRRGRLTAARIVAPGEDALAVLGADRHGRPTGIRPASFEFPNDDFERADGPLGDKWIQIGAYTEFLIASGVAQAQIVGDLNGARWADTPLPNNVFPITFQCRVFMPSFTQPFPLPDEWTESYIYALAGARYAGAYLLPS
ncbi:unnamed protein product, partial [marine sediment metagenome]